jgi:hypothetical protein
MKRIFVLAVLLAMSFFGISQTLDKLNKPVIGGFDEIAQFNEGLYRLVVIVTSTFNTL